MTSVPDTSFIARAAITRAAAAAARARSRRQNNSPHSEATPAPGIARNFVDAVQAHDRKKLNAEVQIGHQSTAWCNLADVALRAGQHYSHDEAIAIRENYEPWDTLVELIEQHLAKNSVDIAKSKSPTWPAARI